VELKSVTLVGDSLIGIVARDPVPGMERFAIPVTGVQRIEVRRTDTGVTALLVFGVVVIVGAATALLVALSQYEMNFGN
jgi:hypothetical protein